MYTVDCIDREWYIMQPNSGGRACARCHYEGDARTIADALNQSAQLRAENERLYLALKRCVPWMGRLIADGGHLKCVAPNDAVGALEQAEAALGKGAA